MKTQTQKQAIKNIKEIFVDMLIAEDVIKAKITKTEAHYLIEHHDLQVRVSEGGYTAALGARRKDDPAVYIEDISNQ